MNRLFLLEDDIGLIDGLKYALKKNGFELEVARTVKEARRRLAKGPAFDLLLLDVTLPDGTGFTVCEEVRASGDTVPIIFLTASDEETSVIRGLDSGADDYITKPFKLGELCSRIRAQLRRSAMAKPSDASLLVSGPVKVDQLAGKVYLNGELLELTGAEYRLLSLMLRHPGQTLTRDAIFDELWDGNGNYVDDNTLSVYIRRLRGKIERDPSNPEYIITVRGMGYRWEEKI